MNKIISINLKGLVFQVEEEAFEHLQKYLELLNQHFANEESRLEIIDDIESRIAEMLQEKLKTPLNPKKSKIKNKDGFVSMLICQHQCHPVTNPLLSSKTK